MDNSYSDASSAGIKRKRTPGAEEGRSSAPPGPLVQGLNVTPSINYLMRAKSERLRLIEGENDTFAEILGMIDDYEGVLNRHESLAANLGAKLVGPLLLKSFEKLFDGPIKIIQPSFVIEHSPISWLDIITFARTNPGEFILSQHSSGTKSCQFWIKGGQVEISEDDYRLIMSGGPERMIPTQPLPEDESAELGTLYILEARLTMLIKKADAVASKARQLNYHLKGRKSVLLGRKAAEQPNALDPEGRTFSPQPFSAVNARPSQPPNSEAAKLQAQLLDQYQSLDRRTSLPPSRSKANRPSTTEGFVAFNGQDPEARRLSHPPTSSEDGTENKYRVIMATKIEKLHRGDPIDPPCDRCRRLKFECTKHLTACQACTKKHAKCSWKDIKEGELDGVPQASVASPQRQPTAGNGHLLADSPLFVPENPSPTGQQNQSTLSVTEDERMEDDSKFLQEHSMLAQIATAAEAASRQ
ncbi:hypothetical protein EG329_008957 [Mollisiaceae sp. DMI_Dod_QoI]|nr:hypothetical protein EG329_008957 [Helotiales sp. DMI_Dod_QoI]